ncbi:alpha-xylosidase [Microbacterium sp.]|uniref:alpha-xylosidase n=1 Tax=Microbacterium sp. TaxID=51671 RepID=UPI0039E35A5E
MKFSHGYWLLRDGVTAAYAVEAVDVTSTSETVSVAALSRPLVDRGSHLNTPTITTDLDAPASDVIRVRVSRRTRLTPARPQFVLDESAATEKAVTVTRDPQKIALRSGDLTGSLAVSGPWSLRFRGHDRPLTSAGAKSTASMHVADDGPYMLHRLTLPVGASVYGFGERFTPFVKNGQVIDSWNEDGGTASDQAYKSIPFFVTDAGFGVFVNTPAHVSFEVASEVVSAVQFSTAGDDLEYLLIYGPSPREILERYTAMTGRPALPPKWSFGLWLTTSFTTDYDEETVTEFVDGMSRREIPMSVFHFDCYWMKPLNWCDFEWDRSAFPDPEGMLTRLHDRGLRTSAWINPYIGQRSSLFREAADAGYLVRRRDGTVWQWDLWVAGMALVDFTNPAARDWFAGKIRHLLRQGIDAIKADFGERIPTDVVWHDGSDPDLMHNHYSQLYNQTVFEAVEDERGRGEAVLFARSATAGGQQFPVHWGGDCEATYESMAESLRAGLSLGLSGFGFWSHDIGGFEGTPSAALFKRWLLFGLFSSHARLHGSDSYRVPWAFDEQAVQLARDFGRLRNRLMPYLWNAACEAHTRGLPMLRAMVLEFPDDPTCAPLDRQYMLGGDLLVAPVFSDDGDVTYYLPEGTWTNLLDGRRADGGRWLRERHDFDSLPVWIRGAALIPFGSRSDRPDYDVTTAPVFHLGHLDRGETATTQLRDEHGAVLVRVSATREGDWATVRVDEGGDLLTEGWGVTLAGRPSQDVVYSPDGGDLTIVLA